MTSLLLKIEYRRTEFFLYFPVSYLGENTVGSLQVGFHPLWRFGRELDGHLEEVNGELGVGFSRQPSSESFVNILSFVDL